MKKELYRTVIEIEVLSDEPITENASMSDIIYETDEGSWSGFYHTTIQDQKIVGIDAVNEIRKHGTDLSFFEVDDDGNICDDY